MLFYTKIKRDFAPGSWKDGQATFRSKKLSGIRLEGEKVYAQVRLVSPSSDLNQHDTEIEVVRGAIGHAHCSCGCFGKVDKFCGHVAALAVWLVERGSLLKAGVGGEEYGMDTGTGEEEEEAKPIPGQAVLWVKGIVQNKNWIAISVESAIRFVLNPEKPDTFTLTGIGHLTRHILPGVWRNPNGVLLQIPVTSEPANDLNYISKFESQPIINYGVQALESIIKLLNSPHKDQIAFDESAKIEIDPEPLKLVSLKIGQKTAANRVLSYEFANSNVKFSSLELQELAKQGKVNTQYVWKLDRIHRFETSLLQLYRFANRSGVSSPDGDVSHLLSVGFGSLRDDSDQPLHPLAAYRLSLELGVENFQVDAEWTEFHEWKKTFDRKKIAPLPKVEYGFELREYQENGLTWLWSLYHRGLASLLADEMGLGKTHQVLAFLTSIYHPSMTGKDKVVHPSLVVAPTSVVAAWIQKLKKYDTGLRWQLFHGNSRKLADSGVDLVLTTYGILQREAILREKNWHVVVLDEAQAIKNATTISSRASRTLKSKYRIAMTGTPIENQATDLWSLMEFLLPGYLGSLPRFKRLYGWGRETPSDQQAAALKRLISPFLLRRTKNKVLKELPEKIEEMVYCELTIIQKKAYKDILSSAEAEKARAELESGTGGKVDYANILAVLTRLKQVCDHPKLMDLTSGKIKRVATVNPFEAGKWEVFDEILNEALRSGLKVVIFTQYLGMMDIISHYLKTNQIGYTELRGDTPDRGKRLEIFQDDPDCKVFLCSLLAGGLGIDLTAASVCIHYDRWWNPAKENQATDRLHRLGQTRGVQVFKLQMPGTVEDRISQIIESKMNLSGALIEESSTGLKTFSRKELLDLLTFKPEAFISSGLPSAQDDFAVEDDPNEEYSIHT